MAEQSKEDQIKDKLCDAILKYTQGSTLDPVKAKMFAETYEIMFGKYQGVQAKQTSPMRVFNPNDSDNT